jgi:hypothetical protein
VIAKQSVSDSVSIQPLKTERTKVAKRNVNRTQKKRDRKANVFEYKVDAKYAKAKAGANAGANQMER